jgi:hypothetical protein
MQDCNNEILDLLIESKYRRRNKLDYRKNQNKIRENNYKKKYIKKEKNIIKERKC